MIKWLFPIMLFSFVVIVISIPNKNNNTNPVDGRSGLNLYTDNLTGCQYLGRGLGNQLIPRMDKNGKQVCIDVVNP